MMNSTIASFPINIPSPLLALGEDGGQSFRLAIAVVIHILLIIDMLLFVLRTLFHCLGRCCRRCRCRRRPLPRPAAAPQQTVHVPPVVVVVQKKKSVRFVSTPPQVHEVESFSPQERERCYVTEAEQKRTEQCIDTVVARMEKHEPCGKHETYRGLEFKTCWGDDNWMRFQAYPFWAVIEEQSNQRRRQQFDADRIAAAVLQFSADSAKRARQMGLEDEREATLIKAEYVPPPPAANREALNKAADHMEARIDKELRALLHSKSLIEEVKRNLDAMWLLTHPEEAADEEGWWDVVDFDAATPNKPELALVITNGIFSEESEREYLKEAAKGKLTAPALFCYQMPPSPIVGSCNIERMPVFDEEIFRPKGRQEGLRDDVDNARDSERIDEWKCHVCGTLNPDDESKCKKCEKYRKADDSAPKGWGVLMEAKKGYWKCPNCFVSNPPDEVMCLACTPEDRLKKARAERDATALRNGASTSSAPALTSPSDAATAFAPVPATPAISGIKFGVVTAGTALAPAAPVPTSTVPKFSFGVAAREGDEANSQANVTQQQEQAALPPPAVTVTPQAIQPQRRPTAVAPTPRTRLEPGLRRSGRNIKAPIRLTYPASSSRQGQPEEKKLGRVVVGTVLRSSRLLGARQL